MTVSATLVRIPPKQRWPRFDSSSIALTAVNSMFMPHSRTPFCSGLYGAVGSKHLEDLFSPGEVARDSGNLGAKIIAALRAASNRYSQPAPED